MTNQEWILLALALPTTIGALYCLRQRPEFGDIERNDDETARESLEIGAINIGASVGGDLHTQSIVESVIGQKETLDENIVNAALGEMGEIAAANAAAEKKQVDEMDSEPIMDSRFTTTIPDEDTTEMVSAYVNDESETIVEENQDDGIGWGVWEPDEANEDVSQPAEEVSVEIELEPSEEEVIETELELPEIPEIFREPIVDTPDPLEIPSIPEIPTFETPKLTERISTIATQAADATILATKEVVTATVSGAKEVASIAAGITEKVVEKVRPKATKSVMPVRPPGLPPMAEWDPYMGAWTLMGRPVHTPALPEPETVAPSWVDNQPEVATLQDTVTDELEPVGTPRRQTPFIPELP